jgi:hypothetical protein
MAQAPSKWIWYDQALFALGKKLIDLSTDQFAVALFTSASIAINSAVNPATYAAFAADGHEVPASGGYSTGGVNLGAGTWAASPARLALPNAVWNTSGGGITFRAAVLYHVGTGRALAYMIADSTPADYTANSGLLTIAVGLWMTLVQQ